MASSPWPASQAAAAEPFLLACLTATWLVWGSTYLAIKWALVSFPPFFQMGTRFVCAGALLFAWARWARRLAPPRPEQWRNALILGALMLGCGMGGTAFAEQSIGSGLVVVFIAVMPMLVALINRLFGVRPRRSEVAGIAIGFVGVVLLVRGNQFQASPQGLLAMCLGCSGWALGSVLSQRWLALADGSMGYASQMLCGGALLLLVSLGTGERPDWPPAAGPAWAWVYLVVFGSLVAFNAYMVLLARTSMVLAASYSFVNPVIALALGATVGGEHFSASEWAAAAIVLAGVGMLLWGRAAAGARPDSAR